jgi:DNA-binding CsgD family transcriptional regulator
MLSTLTEHQIIVVNLVRRGLSNRQIARELGVTEGTVKTHLHNIFGKLGITRRYALILSKMSQLNNPLPQRASKALGEVSTWGNSQDGPFDQTASASRKVSLPRTFQQADR